MEGKQTTSQRIKITTTIADDDLGGSALDKQADEKEDQQENEKTTFNRIMYNQLISAFFCQQQTKIDFDGMGTALRDWIAL